MDAHALLSAQGWRGKGHSLHATDDSIGLAKPLLLNRKDNTKGLGQKPHFTSDTWWMNAFDEQLQGLDTSKEGRVVQTVTQGRLNQIEKVSGGKWMLYASFVRGGFLEGTIKKADDDDEKVVEESGASTPESEDTSSEDDESEGGVKIKEVKERGETKEERRARRAAKKARKAAREARRTERAARKASKAGKGETKSRDRKESEAKKARREAKKAKREARKAKKGESG